jgi:two-component system sensor histidine kinase VicK
MSNNDQSSATKHSFLKGGGKMGELIRALDWSKTPIGSPDDWPTSLRLAVSIMLSTPFPMYIAWGKDYTQLYNDGYRPILGSSKHPQALGGSSVVTFEEIWHIIGPMFSGVMQGEAVGFPNFMLPLNRNGYVEECFFDFSYSPIYCEDDTVGGVLVTVIETTDKVDLINRLRLSDQRFQNLVRDATVGIIVLTGEELKVSIVNTGYARLIGRTVDDLMDKPLFQIIPESEAVFRPVIDNVRLTGVPVNLYDQPYYIYDGKEEINGFLNLVYQPYKEADGTITGVIVLCQDVTEQINSRKEVETALEQIRLSKEAAELGTFDMDLEKGTMVWDDRCRILFGISHNNPVSYDSDFLPGLHPEDRDRIVKVVENVLIKAVSKGIYDVEYRTIGAEDKRLRWVRAKGQAYFDEHEKPVRFIGSVLDITEQKLDEQRKNDFIGMVSHELKTPLTSMKAYVQMLQMRAIKDNDEFRINSLNKVDKQVNKMSAMINGFLNISRLESGKLHLHEEEFDLDELIKEVIQETNMVNGSHQISLHLCGSQHVFADRDKISHVISNLLSNAIKYSPRGNKVEVNCKMLGNDVEVSVKDDGMGIKEQDIPNLFTRFYRVQSTHTQHISGFGIGLYLCAEIIERHHGRIWVESEKGRGSTFYFTLPVVNQKPL